MKAARRQTAFEFPRRGGRRKGAGRPRTRPHPGLLGPGVPHLRRPDFAARHPVHVTMRLQSGIGYLREYKRAKIVEDALRDARERLGVRIIHYSIQGNHWCVRSCGDEDCRGSQLPQRNSLTCPTPSCSMSSLRAAASDTSTILPLTYGPRSFTRTFTERPLATFSTCRHVPNGSVRCAAVSAPGLKRSPLAVRRPRNASPYQDARPSPNGSTRRSRAAGGSARGSMDPCCRGAWAQPTATSSRSGSARLSETIYRWSFR